MTIGHPRRRAVEGPFIKEPNLSFSSPVSPAITEQLCKQVADHESRHKSLTEMCNDRFQLALANTPEGLSDQEKFLWRMGFAEGMSVVLEYIKSAGPAPR